MIPAATALILQSAPRPILPVVAQILTDVEILRAKMETIYGGMRKVNILVLMIAELHQDTNIVIHLRPVLALLPLIALQIVLQMPQAVMILPVAHNQWLVQVMLLVPLREVDV